jgi:hypothetical protein
LEALDDALQLGPESVLRRLRRGPEQDRGPAFLGAAEHVDPRAKGDAGGRREAS